MATTNWTREQTIVALYAYCQIPFNRVSSSHPLVLKYSKIIDRSPNALKMKIGNFGSFDPELRRRGIVGLVNASQLDSQIWQEFENNWEQLAITSELLISKLLNTSIEKSLDLDSAELPVGKDRETLIKVRVNQNFFRSAILSSYDSTCCITGLNIPELLVASHIIPWSVNKQERTNPRNGLCLNALHDKAFDKGLIGISQDFKIRNSKKLLEASADPSISEFFAKYENATIKLPNRFVPDKSFLDYHFVNIFNN